MIAFVNMNTGMISSIRIVDPAFFSIAKIRFFGENVNKSKLFSIIGGIPYTAHGAQITPYLIFDYCFFVCFYACFRLG